MGHLPFILSASPRRGNCLLAAETFAAALSRACISTPPACAGFKPALDALRLTDFPVRPCIDCGACSSPEAVFPPETGVANSERPEQVCPAPLTPEAGSLKKSVSTCSGPDATYTPGSIERLGGRDGPDNPDGSDDTGASARGIAAPLPAGNRQFGPWSVCPQTGLDQSAALFARLLHAPLVCISAPIYFYHLPAMLKALLDRCQIFWQMREQGKGPRFAAGRSANTRKARVILLGAREKGENLFSGSLLTLKYALAPFGLELAEPLLLYGLDKPGDLAARPDLLQAIRTYGEKAALDLAGQESDILCGRD